VLVNIGKLNYLGLALVKALYIAMRFAMPPEDSNRNTTNVSTGTPTTIMIVTRMLQGSKYFSFRCLQKIWAKVPLYFDHVGEGISNRNMF
jgi:hypothetical protein